MPSEITAPDRATATAMHPLIGRTGTLPVKNMTVQIHILDVKAAPYSGLLLLIEPMAGSGTTWVKQESVTLA